MSCRKVTRALLERFRFGELDAGCDEYLEHVERCPDCQAEIAVDRALARHLRAALRERIEGFEPSPQVWQAVRMQATEPQPARSWSAAMLSLGRAMRVAVPAGAVLLAAVLTWTGPQLGSGDMASVPSPLASRLQWQEQLTTTAQIETAPPRRFEFNPSPSIPQPWPAGDMPFPEPVAAIKISTVLPAGGVIR